MSRRTQKQLVELRLADIRNNKARKGFKWGFSDKTGWDWLDLIAKLAIPIILGIATLLFSLQQANLAQQQHENDQKIALGQQYATTLQTYIDNIQNLLLHDNLLQASPFDVTNPYYDVAILARSRTLAALQGLDVSRKGVLVKFLYEAHLIGFLNSKNKPQPPIINLDGADLTSADLSVTTLNGANLSGTKLTNSNLIDASLNGAKLTNADLSCIDDIDYLQCANLIDAKLVGANLVGADLSKADLSKADLSYANLSGADLRKTNLYGVDLSSANLDDAILNGPNINLAGNLTQLQLDQVRSCKDAILPPGLTCNKTP